MLKMSTFYCNTITTSFDNTVDILSGKFPLKFGSILVVTSEQNQIGLHNKSHYKDYYMQKEINNTKHRFKYTNYTYKFVVLSNNFY